MHVPPSLWLQIMRTVDRSPSKEVTDKDLAALIYHLASILREQVGMHTMCCWHGRGHGSGCFWSSVLCCETDMGACSTTWPAS